MATRQAVNTVVFGRGDERITVMAGERRDDFTAAEIKQINEDAPGTLITASQAVEDDEAEADASNADGTVQPSGNSTGGNPSKGPAKTPAKKDDEL